ncbi:hypothetical protein PYCC9005_001521 [Savitreella phatthalungensis]
MSNDVRASRDAAGNEDHAQSTGMRGPESPSKKNAASIQETLIASLLSSLVPAETSAKDRKSPREEHATPLNLAQLASNFRKFSSRIGVVFTIQNHLTRIYSWQNTRETVGYGMIWTLVCLQPVLLLVLPYVFAVAYFLVPSFLQLHPPPPSNIPLPPELDDTWSRAGALGKAKKFGGTAEGRDFLLNMRDIQNMMADYVSGYDEAAKALNDYANFADEKKSSVTLVVCVSMCLLNLLAANYVQIRLLVLAAGWVAIFSGHPHFKPLVRQLQRAGRQTREKVKKQVAHHVDRQYIDPDTQPLNAIDRKRVLVYEYRPVKPRRSWRRGGRRLSSSVFYSGFATVGHAGVEDDYVTPNLEAVLPPEGYTYVAGSHWTVVDESDDDAATTADGISEVDSQSEISFRSSDPHQQRPRSDSRVSNTSGVRSPSPVVELTRKTLTREVERAIKAVKQSKL